jgi:hypothetical protein
MGMDLLTALQPPELSSPAHWERSRRHHSRIALSDISVHMASFPNHRTGQGRTGTDVLVVTDLSTCLGNVRQSLEHESIAVFSTARQSAYTSSRFARQRFAAIPLCLLVSTYSRVEGSNISLGDDHL